MYPRDTPRLRLQDVAPLYPIMYCYGYNDGYAAVWTKVGALMSEEEVGPRIAALRKAKGLSQERLAQLAGISTPLVKAIEGGRRALTLKTAQRLAPVLAVTDLGQIYGPAVTLSLEARPSHEAIPAVTKALTDWGIGVEGQAQSADYLRAAVDMAWQTWHTSAHQRTETGRILPGLLHTAQRSARLTDNAGARREVLAMLAQTYHLAQAYLAWHGERELVYLTVDRGMSAALEADDPLAIASSVFYAAHVLRAVGRAEEALENLAEARALLERSAPAEGDSLPVEWNAQMADLWICSAVTKARAGDQSAYADLDQAEELIYHRLPEGYVHPWTRTSRILCDITGVMVAADLGDVDQIRERSRNIDPEAIPSTERRARHLIELARGTALEGATEGTLHLLGEAARISPETLAFTPAGRELVEKVVKASGATSRAQADALARRIGIEPQ